MTSLPPQSSQPALFPSVSGRVARHLALALCVGLLACTSSREKLSEAQRLTTHKEMGQYYLEVGDLNRSEDQVLRGLEIDRSDPSLRLMLGGIKLRRGDTESLLKARVVFEGFDGKQEPRAAVGLGETLERLGLVHRDTAESIQKGLRVAPKNDPGAEIERLNKEAEKLWRKAIDSYRIALEANRNELRALNGLQRTYSLLGDYDQAAFYAGEVIAGAEADLTAISARLETTQKKPDAARDERLRNLQRESRKLLLETSWLAYSIEVARNRPDAALIHLDRVIDLDPRDEIAFSRRAQLNFDLGNFQAAIDDATEFVKRSDKPYEDPDIRRAWQLRYDAELALKTP